MDKNHSQNDDLAAKAKWRTKKLAACCLEHFARGNKFSVWYLSRKLQNVKTFWRSSDFPNAFSRRIAKFRGLILGVPARKTVDIISRELTCLAAEISRFMKQAESFLVQRMQLLSPWRFFDLNTSRAILSASAASDKTAQQTNSRQEHLASFEMKLVSAYFKPREDFIQISFQHQFKPKQSLLSGTEPSRSSLRELFALTQFDLAPFNFQGAFFQKQRCDFIIK